MAPISGILAEVPNGAFPGRFEEYSRLGDQLRHKRSLSAVIDYSPTLVPAHIVGEEVLKGSEKLFFRVRG